MSRIPTRSARDRRTASVSPSREPSRDALQALGASLMALGAALLTYWLFSRHGEKIREWIPKVTITREPEIVLTDVHRNGHSKAKLGDLGRL